MIRKKPSELFEGKDSSLRKTFEKATKPVILKSRTSEKELQSLIAFCTKHPELRFWQAVSAWTKKDITVGGEDPFYWKGKSFRWYSKRK